MDVRGPQVTQACGRLLLLCLLFLICSANQTHICFRNIQTQVKLHFNTSVLACLYRGNVVIDQNIEPACSGPTGIQTRQSDSEDTVLPTAIDLDFLALLLHSLKYFPVLFNATSVQFDNETLCYIANLTYSSNSTSLLGTTVAYWETQPLPVLLLILCLQICLLLPAIPPVPKNSGIKLA
uniref:GP3 protein n=1 Tax=Simian hemorrhagic fever virus TaxID=38143 RepID=A0A077EPM2_SHFV|nr:GP3 protein [Simian hemorrhagic fever virus]AIL48163.1 GP3 protein [Simian hemorrhagic fever virus]